MVKIHQIIHENGITKVRFLGKPAYDQILPVIDELVDNYPCERRLWDLSGINFDLSSAKLKSISEYGKRRFTKPGRLALVAPDNLAFGEMRQFGVYREEGNTVTAIFRSEQEAIEWLNS